MRYLTPRQSGDRHGNALGRATVETTDDTFPMQRIQSNNFSKEAMDDIEHVHPYGFSANPQKPDMLGGVKRAAEAFLSYIGGNRSHGVVMATGDRRFRLFKLKPGEVGLHDDQGHQVHITRDGVFSSAPNSKKIVAQIMSDDTLPQDSGQQGQAKYGQIPQAGRNTVATVQMDKTTYTITNPGTIILKRNDGTMIELDGSGNVQVKPGGGMVFLGGTGSDGTYDFVVTLSGPSTNVKAKIG